MIGFNPSQTSLYIQNPGERVILHRLLRKGSIAIAIDSSITLSSHEKFHQQKKAFEGKGNRHRVRYRSIEEQQSINRFTKTELLGEKELKRIIRMAAPTQQSRPRVISAEEIRQRELNGPSSTQPAQKQITPGKRTPLPGNVDIRKTKEYKAASRKYVLFGSHDGWA